MNKPGPICEVDGLTAHPNVNDPRLLAVEVRGATGDAEDVSLDVREVAFLHEALGEWLADRGWEA